MRPRKTFAGISVAILILVMAAGFGVPQTARGAADLRICGRVNLYVAPTAVLAGAITVGPTALLIAAGTDISALVEVGANLCFDLELDTSGRITDAAVRVNATSSLEVCGVVTALVDADANSSGSLRIGGVDFILAAASQLPASVRVGADLCLDLTLNAFGQVSGGTARANATSTARVCGVVTAFAEADSNSTGRLTIGGRTFVLAIGSRLPASVDAGANLCLTLTINALAQVAGGTAQANVTSTLEVCGHVTAHAAATATTNGSLTIDGIQRSVAAGVSLSPQVRAGAFLRLRLTLDVFGRIADDVVLAAGASFAAVCGPQAVPTPTPAASGSSAPGGSSVPNPSGSPSADASASPSGAGAPAGSAGASPTTRAEGAAAGNAGSCADEESGQAAAGSAGSEGGVVPDTASLARAGRVIGVMAVPLLMLVLAVFGSVLWQQHRLRAADRSEIGVAGTTGGGEVAS